MSETTLDKNEIPATARLYYGRQEDTLNVFILHQEPVSVGKSPDNNLVLEGDKIAPEHIILEYNHNRWHVIDLTDNTYDTFLDEVRLLQNIAEEWKTGQVLRIDDFDLFWEPITQTIESQKDEKQVQPDKIEVQITVIIDNEKTFIPESQSQINVEITNLDRIKEEFFLRLVGIDDSWVINPENSLHLLPGESGVLSVQLHLPALNSAPTGTYPFTLEVRSGEDQIVAYYEDEFTIPSVEKISSQIVPSDLLYQTIIAIKEKFLPWLPFFQLRHQESCQLILKNEGNCPTIIVISGHDNAEEIEFSTPSEPTQLEIQEIKPVSIHLRPKKRIGRRQQIPFSLIITNDSSARYEEQGNLDLRPIHPAWLLLLLTIFASILFLVGSILPSNKSPNPIAVSTNTPGILEGIQTSTMVSTIVDEITTPTATMTISGNTPSKPTEENTPSPTDAPPTTISTPTKTAVPIDTPTPTIIITSTKQPPVTLDIKEEGTHIRAGPGEDYCVIEIRDSGTEYQVIARTQNNDWYKIVFDNGRFGWVHASRVGVTNTQNLFEVPTPPLIKKAYLQIKNCVIFLRDESNLNSQFVTIFIEDGRSENIFEIIARTEQGDWYLITDNNEILFSGERWIGSSLIELISINDSIPVISGED